MHNNLFYKLSKHGLFDIYIYNDGVLKKSIETVSSREVMTNYEYLYDVLLNLSERILL